MSSPYVRPVGGLADFDGMTVVVGVDYDTVTIHQGAFQSGGGIRLSAGQAEEFARLFVSACQQAGQQQGLMAGEASRPAPGPGPENGETA